MVILTVTSLICHVTINRSDGMQYYIPINIIQFKLLSILTENHIPLRYTSDFLILLHHPPSALRSLSKSHPTAGLAFACGGTNPDWLP